MRVYVESNFVLELALRQKEHGDCSKLLEDSRSGRLQLVIPAYALMESYEVLIRRHGERKNLVDRLEAEFTQLARDRSLTAEVKTARQNVSRLLTDSVDENNRAFLAVREQLLQTAHIIPLDGAILSSAHGCENRFGLPLKDAVIYASVVAE